MKWEVLVLDTLVQEYQVLRNALAIAICSIGIAKNMSQKRLAPFAFNVRKNLDMMAIGCDRRASGPAPHCCRSGVAERWSG